MRSKTKQQSDSYAVPVLVGGLLLVILLAILAAIYVARAQSANEQYLLRTAEQRVLAHQVAQYTRDAASGNEGAFALLLKSRGRFTTLLNELKNGSEFVDLPPSPEIVQPAIKDVESAWLELRAYADAILDNQKRLVLIGETSKIIAEFTANLAQTTNRVARVMVKENASQRQVYLITRQLQLIQRIDLSLDEMLEGGATTAISVDQLTRDVEDLRIVFAGLLKGDKQRQIAQVTLPEAEQDLLEIAALLGTVNDHVQELLEAVPLVMPALEVLGDSEGEMGAAQGGTAARAPGLTMAADRVSEKADKLIALYETTPGLMEIGFIKIGPTVVMLLAFLAVALLVVLGYKQLTTARKQGRDSAEQYQRNQDAIRRLLDEMGDLADGDLTVEATVTEDITGAIADSVNYAIEAMRELVVNINETAVQVSGSAQENRATFMHLAEAAGHQREEITNATDRIATMAQAIEAMAADATASAEVAEQSVQIASQGGEAVRRTISGMDNIREQIQETSKRIKRLGESSQEIGNIIELIEDIADQTNILALNAAMQAAMAGEAGRGFAVVADEVQRLAERSTNATKQIEALVKTIQADTREAVASMETSTTEVVAGAKLAEDAGDSLREIEQVSQRIADITKNISDSAQTQADEAARINDTMNVIQEITTQTSESTQNTAESINTLSDQVNELRISVAGFRLPE